MELKGLFGVNDLLHSAPRLAEIVRVLARHGFLASLRGEHFLPPPEEVRKAFEELGPVFVKFGQVLALRRDILPEPYVTELERLHDRLPPLNFDVVRSVIESELGAPLEQMFASFAEPPLATATIAQVHAATLHDGRPVVVKVRRPNLEAIVAEDVGVLSYLAVTAENVVPRLRALDLGGAVREFHESLLREMDLGAEARTIQRFRAAFADAPEVWIPDAISERTAKSVLTMEHSPGERLDAYAAHHTESARSLAERLGVMMVRSVFEVGLFHADPHPGNVFVLPDERLCFHDFGMVGELGDRMRGELVRLLEACVAGDARALTDAYLDLVGTTNNVVDRPSLEQDLDAILRSVRERPASEISAAETFQSVLRVGSHRGIRNPGGLLLLTRAFLITEGVMRALAPQLNLIEVAQKEMPRIAAGRYSLPRLMQEARRAAREFERFLQTAPADAQRALRRLADGNVGVYAPSVETFARRISRDLERLTGGIASAALLVSGSMIVSLAGWHHWLGDAFILLGLAGTFLVAAGALLKRRG